MYMRIPPLRITIMLESNPSEIHNVSREIGRNTTRLDYYYTILYYNILYYDILYYTIMYYNMYYDILY